MAITRIQGRLVALLVHQPSHYRKVWMSGILTRKDVIFPDRFGYAEALVKSHAKSHP
jgi:hypothetical protein